MAIRRCELRPDIKCTGCGVCKERPVYEDQFGDPIYEGEKYYDIDGDIVSECNLERWAKRYLREAIRYVV